MTSSPLRSLGRRSLVFIGLAALAVAGLFLLWYARDVFFLAFAGLLFAVFLSALAGWTHRFLGLSYRWSLALVIILLLILIGLVGWLVGARVFQQFQQFQDQLPTSWDEVRQQLLQSQWGQWAADYLPEAKQIAKQFGSYSQLNWVISTIGGFIVGVVVILFVGVYVAAEPGWYRSGALRLIPKERRSRWNEVFDAAGYTLQWWLIGQLISMTVVGVLTGIGLYFLGVKLALVLALIAFAFEFIPNIGPLASAIPAVLIAWAQQGSTTALWVVLLYSAIQLLESYVIMPIVYREAVWLPPALTLLTVVLLGMIGGLLGVLVAAPLIAVIIVFVKMLYVEDLLHDRSIAVPGEGQA